MTTRGIGLLFVLVLAGCTRSAAPVAAPDGDDESASWLCRPDRSNDPCGAADLATTDLLAGGSREVLERRPAAEPRADCFYVYPTVDLDLVPGNHLELTDTRRMLAVTLAQAGAFRETCALWVPLYRQVTIGTYLQPRAALEEGLARAYADVERAFREYLAVSGPGRKIVLIGHSQGGEMIIRLVRRFFDGDAAMRERLVLAMAIGADVEVPASASTGGTFASVPVCSRPLETGCVVAFRTHRAGVPVRAGRWAPKPGNETVCVDPATLDGPASRLTRAVFPLRDAWGGKVGRASDAKTPFVSLPGFFAASCVRGEQGYAYLAASSDPPAGDTRTSPVDFADRGFDVANLGLHVLDLQLTQGDLVALVARRMSPSLRAPGSIDASR